MKPDVFVLMWNFYKPLSLNNLFFLLYLSDTPVLIRLILRPLKQILRHTDIKKLEIPLDYQYLIKSGSNLEDFFKKIPDSNVLPSISVKWKKIFFLGPGTQVWTAEIREFLG